MSWRSVAGSVAVLSVGGALLATPATAADSGQPGLIPPHTLTQAGYVTANGTRGQVELERAGTSAKIPGKEPIVVSLGESYISGEAGRWAGNSSLASWSEYSDVYGDSAYWDLKGAEAIPGCHRSKAAAIHFGAGTTSVNLACSGALTTTLDDSSAFKPGIDFADTRLYGGAHGLGQATLLRNLAASNPGRITMVNLSIGGNDFLFQHIVETCVTQYVVAGTPCSRVSDITKLFTDENVSKQRLAIARAIANVFKAMSQAGYKPTQWTLAVQTYPSPIASRATIRYGQTYARQFTGGCGFYDKDLDWANDVALPKINGAVKWAAGVNAALGNRNIVLLDLSQALTGHRLCEKGTEMVGPVAWWPWGLDWSPVRSWQQQDAVDRSEWVAQIRATTKVGLSAPYTLYESFHPNYWGQKAYQNCYRQVYNGGKVRGGTCVNTASGLTQDGLPRMQLK